MSKNDDSLPPENAGTASGPNGVTKTRTSPKKGWRDPDRRRAFALGSLRDDAGARPIIKPVPDA